MVNIGFKFYFYFTKGNERSIIVKKNIAASLVLKCVSILVSLQVVPLTIDYINPTIWNLADFKFNYSLVVLF